MADGFGWISPVPSPHLERIVREERLQRDLPRKQQDARQGRTREEPHRKDPEPASAEDPMTSVSSTHIDLRI
jgi:hypothetical protein